MPEKGSVPWSPTGPVLALCTAPVSGWTSKPGTAGCELHPLILWVDTCHSYMTISWVFLWLLPLVAPVSRDFNGAGTYGPSVHWIQWQLTPPLVQSNPSMGEAIDRRSGDLANILGLALRQAHFHTCLLVSIFCINCNRLGAGLSLGRVCTAPGTLCSSPQSQLCKCLSFHHE